jgi:dihydrofolate reductase
MSPRGCGSLDCMTRTTCHVTISLDGYLAGAEQSMENPLGIGGERLHEWAFPSDEQPILGEDVPAWDHLSAARGAYVMGRHMFGPAVSQWTGWDDDWRGWWGEEPPYHAPVFVLTHHEREPVEMAGGTTFHFVTDGFDAAYGRAVEAAGEDGEVLIAGGASTIRQALAAGVLDELYLDISPILLGGGERLFDGVVDPGLTPVEVIESPRATHIRYRIGG